MVINARLAATGNLLSAFSAGAVLSTFIERRDFASIDVILTYILGAALSLIILRTLGTFLRRRLPVLSLLASAAFVLLGNVHTDSVALKSAIVSALFGLLFVPRTLRTEAVGETTKALPLVEFAYSAGYLVAFLLPSSVFDGSLTAIGASLTIAVAAFDSMLVRVPREGAVARRPEARLAAREWWHILRFCGLTVGCQLVLQTLAAEYRNTFPLIGFELGTTLAPLAYTVLASRFPRTRNSGISALVFSALTTLTLVAALRAPFVVSAATAAAFFYEYVAIGLLQGLAEKHGAIARAFAINAVASSAIYWICQRSHVTLLALGAAMTSVSLVIEMLPTFVARYLYARGD